MPRLKEIKLKKIRASGEAILGTLKKILKEIKLKIVFRLRRGDFRYTKIFNMRDDIRDYIRDDIRDNIRDNIRTLSNHFIKALHQSTLHKHFIKALYTSTLSKHFIQALYQGVSKSILEIPVKVLRQGIKTR